LSEENLMKMSRSASGISKRDRKALEDGNRAESEAGDMKTSGTGRGKRSKFQHSYKLDLEDAAPPHRKNGTFGTSSSTRRAATPTSNPSQLHPHHQLQRQPSTAKNALSIRPRKIIRISSVVDIARRNPRRHLGFFKYEPQANTLDIEKPSNQKFDVSIRPNLLPSFADPEQINCTYTVRVPRMWLRPRERGLVCGQRYLWGTGIYTDDSDPLAAAMHSGFIASVYPPGVDEALLEKVIHEQNSQIEGSPAPEKPQPVDENKDLHITLVVLPQLEQYCETARFGVKSRSWPDAPAEPNPSSPSASPADNKTPHDGVSFMVLKTEFVDDGVEVKRVGRTGKEKRARLQRELMERKRGLELEQQLIERAAAKAKAKKDELLRRQAAKKALEMSAASSSTEKLPSSGVQKTNGESQATSAESAKQSDNTQPDPPKVDNDGDAKGGEKKVMELDVGQSPGDWIRQLAHAAA
jgi:hypothetical protein